MRTRAKHPMRRAPPRLSITTKGLGLCLILLLQITTTHGATVKEIDQVLTDISAIFGTSNVKVHKGQGESAIVSCDNNQQIIWGFKYHISLDNPDASCAMAGNAPCTIGLTSCSISTPCTWQQTGSQYEQNGIIVVCGDEPIPTSTSTFALSTGGSVATATCPGSGKIIFGFKYQYRETFGDCMRDNMGGCAIGLSSCSTSVCSSHAISFVYLLCAEGDYAEAIASRGEVISFQIEEGKAQTLHCSGEKPVVMTGFHMPFAGYFSNTIANDILNPNIGVCNHGEQSCSIGNSDTSSNDEGFITMVCIERATPYPTKNPTRSPTVSPTKFPTKSPTRSPTKRPTRSPTKLPTRSPTKKPTKSPTRYPTKSPITQAPSASPTQYPTASPIIPTIPPPSTSPTSSPTFSPERNITELSDGTRPLINFEDPNTVMFVGIGSGAVALLGLGLVVFARNRNSKGGSSHLVAAPFGSVSRMKAFNEMSSVSSPTAFSGGIGSFSTAATNSGSDRSSPQGYSRPLNSPSRVRMRPPSHDEVQAGGPKGWFKTMTGAGNPDDALEADNPLFNRRLRSIYGESYPSGSVLSYQDRSFQDGLTQPPGMSATAASSAHGMARPRQPSYQLESMAGMSDVGSEFAPVGQAPALPPRGRPNHQYSDWDMGSILSDDV